MPLVELLSTGVPVVRGVTATGLAADARLAETSVIVIAVRIVSIRPQPDLEKALETPVREQVQQRADAASYERRAMAVEQERTIAENELQSRIELATREQHLVQQEGANAQRRATEEAATTRIAATSGAERDRIRTGAEASRARDLGAAHAEAETARLAAYAGVDSALLSALALTALAEHLPAIGTLNLTPDVLTQALTRLGAAPAPAASPAPGPAED